MQAIKIDETYWTNAYLDYLKKPELFSGDYLNKLKSLIAQYPQIHNNAVKMLSKKPRKGGRGWK